MRLRRVCGHLPSRALSHQVTPWFTILPRSSGRPSKNRINCLTWVFSTTGWRWNKCAALHDGYASTSISWFHASLSLNPSTSLRASSRLQRQWFAYLPSAFPESLLPLCPMDVVRLLGYSCFHKYYARSDDLEHNLVHNAHIRSYYIGA